MSEMDSKNKDGIVINRMYAGKYLALNIGHEAINLFAADNGLHYLYLNAYGNFAKEHRDRINWMVLVKRHCSGVDEIVGLAEGLTGVYEPDKPFNDKYRIDEEILEKQKSFCEKEGGVKYGNVSIFDIFSTAGQQSIYITYKAEKLFVPKDKRLFIRYANNTGNVPLQDVNLDRYEQDKSPLRQFVYPNKKPNPTTGRDEDYYSLKNLIENKDLWKESNVRVDTLIRCNDSTDISLIDICCIQDNENCFSNALAHFMDRKEYRKLWVEFFKRYSISLDENYIVEREVDASIKDDNYKKNHPGGGRIDLLIRDESNIIVIENKIKSDINKIESDKDGGQLERYYNYVNWLLTKEKSIRKPSFFVLAPNYNVPKLNKMEGKYILIKYEELYKFLDNNKAVFEGDANFVAFFNAIHRHTFDNICDYLYHEMKNKFFRQIKENKGVK